MWDWSKLPKEEHEAAIEAYSYGRWSVLRQLHDKYSLSPYSYCCDTKGIINHFKHAIENGILQGRAVEA